MCFWGTRSEVVTQIPIQRRLHHYQERKSLLFNAFWASHPHRSFGVVPGARNLPNERKWTTFNCPRFARMLAAGFPTFVNFADFRSNYVFFCDLHFGRSLVHGHRTGTEKHTFSKNPRNPKNFTILSVRVRCIIANCVPCSEKTYMYSLSKKFSKSPDRSNYVFFCD